MTTTTAIRTSATADLLATRLPQISHCNYADTGLAQAAADSLHLLAAYIRRSDLSGEDNLGSLQPNVAMINTIWPQLEQLTRYTSNTTSAQMSHAICNVRDCVLAGCPSVGASSPAFHALQLMDLPHSFVPNACAKRRMDLRFGGPTIQRWDGIQG